jgi:hypothetical protein
MLATWNSIMSFLCLHTHTYFLQKPFLSQFYSWMAVAGLPTTNQDHVRKRIKDLETRLETRGQRPEPDAPSLSGMPGPTATQTVSSQHPRFAAAFPEPFTTLV